MCNEHFAKMVLYRQGGGNDADISMFFGIVIRMCADAVREHNVTSEHVRFDMIPA